MSMNTKEIDRLSLVKAHALNVDYKAEAETYIREYWMYIA